MKMHWIIGNVLSPANDYRFFFHKKNSSYDCLFFVEMSFFSSTKKTSSYDIRFHFALIGMITVLFLSIKKLYLCILSVRKCWNKSRSSAFRIRNGAVDTERWEQRTNRCISDPERSRWYRTLRTNNEPVHFGSGTEPGVFISGKKKVNHVVAN